MKKKISFLLEIAKLKGRARRGWEIHKFKNPETTAEHIFYLTMLVWILGKEKDIDINRAIKIALVHDLCEVYAPDLTSYDAAAINEKGRVSIKEVLKNKPVKKRPTMEQRRRMEKVKEALEKKAMKKILSVAPLGIEEEINSLWIDYEKGRSKEARFVKQADKIINLIQGLDYWREYGKIEHNLWIARIKEVIDDKLLISFLKEIENEFYKKKK